MPSYFRSFCLIVLTVLWISCSTSENPVPINQEELITTVIVTLTPAAGPVVTLQSRDLDGDGPNAPVITVSGNLEVMEFYDGTVEFLDESQSPAEDITAEIKNEDEDHQVFYQVGGNAQMSVTYKDQDSDGNPLGLLFSVTTGPASSGNLTVTLRHLPNKNADGVAEGDIVNAGGETDVTQTFDIDIQ